MAGQQSGRGGLPETMAEFVNRRRREVEHFGQAAEAAARDAYGKAIRGGEDLVLNTQGQVMRFGASLVGAGKPATRTRAPGLLSQKPQRPKQIAAVRSGIVGWIAVLRRSRLAAKQRGTLATPPAWCEAGSMQLKA